MVAIKIFSLELLRSVLDLEYKLLITFSKYNANLYCYSIKINELIQSSQTEDFFSTRFPLDLLNNNFFYYVEYDIQSTPTFEFFQLIHN